MGNRTEPRNLRRTIAGALACVGLALPAAGAVTAPANAARANNGQANAAHANNGPANANNAQANTAHTSNAQANTTNASNATATAARKRTFKSPSKGKDDASPATAGNRTKKPKICADKPPKTRRR